MKLVVTALIKNRENKFLIVKKRLSAAVHSGKWLFPGGKVEKGEDLMTALKREVKEETNIDISSDRTQLSEYEYKRPDGEITVGFCYLCTAINSDVKLSKELEDYAWITQSEFKKFDHIKELEREVRKAFKMRV